MSNNYVELKKVLKDEFSKDVLKEAERTKKITLCFYVAYLVGIILSLVRYYTMNVNSIKNDPVKYVEVFIDTGWYKSMTFAAVMFILLFVLVAYELVKSVDKTPVDYLSVKEINRINKILVHAELGFIIKDKDCNGYYKIEKRA